MEVIICPDAGEIGKLAGAKIAAVLQRKPNAVLGLATGSSPLDIYADLARRVEAGELDVSRNAAFALDEYVGLPPSHEQSYAATIRRTVTEPLHMDPALVHTPDGMADDIEGACRAYDEAIRAAGGVDVQILGIGSNGHIGFNEPTSSLASRTRIKTLAASTRRDNARFFEGEEPPTHCLTQGLGTIMEARELLLVAQGANKADAIARAVEGPITSMTPASILQFHPRATVIIDDAAASKLQLADYYRETYAGKPAWQRFADEAR